VAPAVRTSSLLPSGAEAATTTVSSIPARAAYSDHAPPALPALGMTARFTPSSTARERPTAAPRALKVPPGRSPSSFIQISTPSRSDTRGAGSKGVALSPSSIGVPSTGDSGPYRHIPEGWERTTSIVRGESS
jgi:hypothetical protein